MRALHRSIGLWTALIAGLAAASCLTSARPRPKPQEWDRSQGPVVPHDKFPADCSLCHQSGSWHQIREDFTYDHKKETGVALTGAHDGAQCLRCHNDRGPVAQFAQRGCRGCHDDIHRGQMGSNCVSCHSESDWTPIGAMAAHSRGRFPLMGAHAAAGCARCHKAADSGEFTGADPRCVSCHRDDIARPKGFDHIQAGLTSGCERCHTPMSWAGILPNHTFIIGGPHKVACNVCHTVPGDYSIATCTNCHTKTKTDEQHQGENGYSYSSPACINCHPTGKH